MSTRSLTIVLDDDKTEIVRIYRQSDGYPDGHGVDLAKLCDVAIVNGRQPGATANGMPCLAAQIIAGLKMGSDGKPEPGGIYMHPINTGCDWAEYIYFVRPPKKLGDRPSIECRTQAGLESWPFNMQTKSGRVFKLSPAKVVAKYAPKETGANG